ncbi:unnamed protein product [marine sediment metagenome]|uniref:Uncharacterized protein n=1 Tax=marine sediment metagenome TaxID=412755 RepID=X1PYK1_9ZZZZ
MDNSTNGKPKSVVLSARVDAESYDGFRRCVETEGLTPSGCIRDAIQSMMEKARIETAKAEAAKNKWPWWTPIVVTLGVLAVTRILTQLQAAQATSKPVGYGPATRLLRRDLNPPGFLTSKPSSDNRDGSDSSAGAGVADGAGPQA